MPPPLPPPLSVADDDKAVEVTAALPANGWGTEGEEGGGGGVMYLPPEDKKSHKPLFSRSHVYETVPDNIAQVSGHLLNLALASVALICNVVLHAFPW